MPIDPTDNVAPGDFTKASHWDQLLNNDIALDAEKVAKSGDTMTGDLTIAPATGTADLILDSADNDAQVVLREATANRGGLAYNEGSNWVTLFNSLGGSDVRLLDAGGDSSLQFFNGAALRTIYHTGNDDPLVKTAGDTMTGNLVMDETADIESIKIVSTSDRLIGWDQTNGASGDSDVDIGRILSSGPLLRLANKTVAGPSGSNGTFLQMHDDGKFCFVRDGAIMHVTGVQQTGDLTSFNPAIEGTTYTVLSLSGLQKGHYILAGEVPFQHSSGDPFLTLYANPGSGISGLAPGLTASNNTYHGTTNSSVTHTHISFWFHFESDGVSPGNAIDIDVDIVAQGGGTDDSIIRAGFYTMFRYHA